MHRREFIGTTVTAGLTAGLAPSAAAGAPPRRGRSGRFALDYAPHFGMFRHHGGDDSVGQLEFMAAEGFRSLEDNGAPRRSVEDQNRIAAAMERLEMRMGVFVAHADFGKVTFASGGEGERDAIMSGMRVAVEVAKRMNAKWCTVVPGCLDHRVDIGFQTAHVIDNLRRCAEVCEPAGLTMVLEPLNRRDHPELFLTGMPQAHMIVRAVDSPACRILDDLYHQQITEGNLIPNIDAAWDSIAYFQVGDNPGRKEPTTGEINYRNVFGHLHARGFTGIVGMEHGNSGEGRAGERAVIDAYAACDPLPSEP